MTRIATIIGARPQFIKAAALSKAIQDSSEFSEILIHTGQHYDSNMSDVFFNELKIPAPDFQLDINNLNHGEMTGRMLIEVEKILLDCKPDVVVVYGDTNSTLAGALAARKLKIKLAHVEAGLRSFNMAMPEEVNRILTDRISDYLFCPTDAAIENLKREGYENFDTEIIKSGDIMLDTVNLFRSLISNGQSNFSDQEFVLATIHREENTNDIEKLKTIIAALNEIDKSIKVVLPLHPRTRKKILDNNLILDVQVIPPAGYLEMMKMLEDCSMVITDSGGLQKEAYFFKKKCLTLRDQTEWVELVEHGYNVLSKINKETILDSYSKLLSSNVQFTHQLYGSGKTANCILNTFSKLL